MQITLLKFAYRCYCLFHNYIILHKSSALSAKNNGIFNKVSSRFRLSMENLTRKLGEYFWHSYYSWGFNNLP